MLEQLLEEIRYIRQRLDSHIDDESTDLKEIQKEVVKIREQMAAHKTTIGMITSAIAAFIAVIVSWFSYHVQK